MTTLADRLNAQYQPGDVVVARGERMMVTGLPVRRVDGRFTYYAVVIDTHKKTSFVQQD